MITRRRVVLAFGASALAVPLASFAQQQGKVWRVGFLNLSSRQDSMESNSAGPFSQGLRDLGYIEGKNLQIEWRFADYKFDRLPGLAAELVALKVDAIVSGNTPPTLAAQKATSVIPIIMTSVGDPVGSGFVASLARPGGNITGLSILTGETSPKLLELTLTLLPKLTRLAVLVNPDNRDNGRVLKSIQVAAQKNKLTILTMEARNPQDIDNAFSESKRQAASAVIVSNDVLFFRARQQVVALSEKYRLPAITGRKDNVEAGYLMSYGTDLASVNRRAAAYVDKILRGAKPADLPVEQPTTFDLAINMNTAKLLGVKFPNSILVQATKVIE